jgi:hypothetical protein
MNACRMHHQASCSWLRKARGISAISHNHLVCAEATAYSGQAWSRQVECQEAAIDLESLLNHDRRVVRELAIDYACECLYVPHWQGWQVHTCYTQSQKYGVGDMVRKRRYSTTASCGRSTISRSLGLASFVRCFTKSTCEEGSDQCGHATNSQYPAEAVVSGYISRLL